MSELQIRPLAICVFRDRDRILVGHAFDAHKNERYCRPPGGGIEFGERAVDALRREIREEIGAEIDNPTLLGVLENIFALEGKRRHEVVFVFTARLRDQTLYAVEEIALHEPGWEGGLKWEPLSRFSNGARPFYPTGLLELLSRAA